MNDDSSEARKTVPEATSLDSKRRLTSVFLVTSTLTVIAPVPKPSDKVKG